MRIWLYSLNNQQTQVNLKCSELLRIRHIESLGIIISGRVFDFGKIDQNSSLFILCTCVNLPIYEKKTYLIYYPTHLIFVKSDSKQE